ncbi:MAG: pyridoxamine 5'-phosphate oxidase family protein [Chloroflexaceae bacterium]|nr:pyridoxamine 5'-phosphate oxidase family protein [Chloroflexaceae bacterium]NJL33375.1 pyridoxamine 5'-phosphate oxidase family protein [Chloroflexaceae bacterium]NJO07503.1 pyridoxamine 5'-phosphate oxidase family protein [Chloroflexaceae bacterium]
MEVHNFAEIEAEFLQRVHTMVWCSVATVDSRQRPRSRILHPIWEGATGWIGTGRRTHKAQHLAANPYVSLAYIADITKPVYVDCKAEWVDEIAERQRIWEWFRTTPEPLGYDPAPIFGSIEEFGLLKLTPWRIELITFPASSLNAAPVWRSNA